MGQMLKDEGDKDVVGVLAFRICSGLLEDFPGVVANCVSPGIELLDLVAPGRAIRRGSEQLAFLKEDIVELLLEYVELGSVAAGDRAMIAWLVEKNGRLFELIEKEDHRAEQEDQELQRYFDDGVEEQSDAAGAERISGEIPLHLGLVRAKIGKRKKKATEDSGPKGIALRGID